MHAFVWNSCFETGISTIDVQHQRLVEIVNYLGSDYLSGQLTPTGFANLFEELTAYANVHFAHEESLMAEVGMDSRYQDAHIRQHRQFVDQVNSIWSSRESIEHPVQVIHEFLASWLTVHILGEDQKMARHMARIRNGEAPEVVFTKETGTTDPATTLLLSALGRLYNLASQQNSNLMHINQALETRVRERTLELEEANRKLLLAEKLTAVGQLAAGVAHELNTPIGYITCNINTLADYFNEAIEMVRAYRSKDVERIRVSEAASDFDFVVEDAPLLLADTVKGLDRITSIVRDLKTFSHVDRDESGLADLNAAMTSTLHIANLPPEIQIDFQPGAIPSIPCYPAKVNQVFLNLLQNAAQSITGPGSIRIRSLVEGNSVIFTVTDSGCGIPESIRTRIFEPFFSTKGVGKGTGLGLAISYDMIVKEMQGELVLESTEPGVGSTFRVALPMTNASRCT
jgi:hemerythrin-like metal-binding protein